MIRYRDQDLEVLHQDCVTDNFGPERHSQCIWSYHHEGVRPSFNETGMRGCQKTEDPIASENPSSRNKRCRQFRKIKGEKFMPKKGESLKIIYKNSKGKKVATTCYYMKRRFQHALLMFIGTKL